jgi:hypothetical protein
MAWAVLRAHHYYVRQQTPRRHYSYYESSAEMYSQTILMFIYSNLIRLACLKLKDRMHHRKFEQNKHNMKHNIRSTNVILDTCATIAYPQYV